MRAWESGVYPDLSFAGALRIRQALAFRQSSFTTYFAGRSRVLHNKVFVSEASDPPQIPLTPGNTNCLEYKAIWDTGATNSVITQKVVDECKLNPVGVTMVEHGGGSETTNLYLVDIALPNKVIVQKVQVAKLKIRDADALIGMDIIGNSDFAVTNMNNQTVFSFRLPSCQRIDFYQNPFKPKPALAMPKGKRKR